MWSTQGSPIAEELYITKSEREHLADEILVPLTPESPFHSAIDSCFLVYKENLGMPNPFGSIYTYKGLRIIIH